MEDLLMLVDAQLVDIVVNSRLPYTNFGAFLGYIQYTRFTRGQPTSVFNHIDYNTSSSSAWAFAYQLFPAVNPLEESTRVK